MDSDRKLYEIEKMNEEGDFRVHFQGGPMPAICDAARTLKALDKLLDHPFPHLAVGSSSLLPLTPFERGYVIGLLQGRKGDRR